MKKILLATLVASTALFSACNNGSDQAELKTDTDSITYATGAVYCANSVGNMQSLKDALMQMGSDSAYVDEFLRGVRDGFESAEEKKEVAYYLGASLGVNLRTNLSKSCDNLVYGDDSTKHVEVANILTGFLDALNDTIALKNAEGKPMNQNEIMAFYQRKAQQIYDDRMKKTHTKEIQAEQNYFNNLKKKPGVKPLKDGVYYKEITAGTGAKVVPGQYVEIEYTGTLTNGTQFDSNVGNPAKMPAGVGYFVPGFDAAVCAMSVGSEWEVYIPSDQAYGAQERGNIKPYSTLVFRIKVLSAEDAPTAPQQ